jgi:hypothetical protein
LTGPYQGWTASVDGDVIKAHSGFEMGNLLNIDYLENISIGRI